jgi:alpha-galactosidase
VTPEPHHLRGAGVSVLLTPSPSGAAVLRHWGADLGDLTEGDLAAIADLHRPGVPHSALDAPRYVSVLPDTGSGFTGTPAVEGLRPAVATAWAPRFLDWSWTGNGERVRLTSRDDEAGLRADWVAELTEEGLLRVRATLTNIGPGDFLVQAVRLTLPVPAAATELLDLTGRWCRERAPQRHAWPQGAWVRSGRHGRTGHDATLLLVAGTPGFGFRSGHVWGVHLAWSGDHETYAERTPEGECLLGARELLAPGEVTLEEGASYTTPWLAASASEHGLDGLSQRLHRWTRRHQPRTRSPRPVVVNTWEAAYFDHDLDRLHALADAAAEIGAERFVLDDGWFRGRRDDRAGLGDWYVDEAVWPFGLHPLADHVLERGMRFGLWVEPEMVNDDSDLARAHPEWVLRGRAAASPSWRHQQVLDLQRPDAFAHVHDALVALLEEYPVSFLKWDHNRDLVDVAHEGRPAVHGQTLAVYRMLDELRSAYPDLEIESCASGGARLDLGILLRTDRVWPSDTLDPVERTSIQRWTTLLLPPELLGAHVGAPVSHTTGRAAPLAFRAATALIGHFGVEWDITAATRRERADLRDWVDLYKRLRHLVVDGTLVRGDHPDPALAVTGLVSPDRTEAVYVAAEVAASATQSPTPVLLDGLDPDLQYLVRSVAPTADGPASDLGTSWTRGSGVRASGRVLARVGVRLPVMTPQSAYVLHLTSGGGS